MLRYNRSVTAPLVRIVIGWIRDQFSSSAVEVVEQLDVPVTSSQRGYNFQRQQFEKLFKGLSDWPSIGFFDAYGDPITSLEDISGGPDGGIDAIIRINTRTERGAKNVATRIRNMIVDRNY